MFIYIDKLHPEKISVPHSHGTLNRKVRVEEMKRIWNDNMKMLHNIQNTKTHYPIQ